MSDENIVMESGFLVRDASVKPVTTKSGNKGYSANFTLAVNNSYKNKQGESKSYTNYLPYHSFLRTEGQANFYRNSLTKGKAIGVKGSVRNNNYTSAKNGKMYSFQFIPNDIHFLYPKKQNN